VVPVAGFDAVTLDYGQGHGLFGLDLRVYPGERVAIIGPSGAGKSSALALMNGLSVPTGGAATILGLSSKDLISRSGRSTRARIGSIHQSLHLAQSMRVVHNVSAGRLSRWSTARALTSLLVPQETQDVRDALARVGIEDLIWTRTDKLSGGQRQRVAVARLLMQDPDLVLADEPVSSLDPGRSHEVMQLLVEATNRSEGGTDRTLVMSLHDPDLARTYADRIIGLSNGYVQFDAPARDVTDETLELLYKVPTQAT
jgi:phosphonate transport system ATP-binding protein